MHEQICEQDLPTLFVFLKELFEIWTLDLKLSFVLKKNHQSVKIQTIFQNNNKMCLDFFTHS